MTPDIEKEFSSRLAQLKAFDFDGLLEAIVKVPDQILATGFNTATTIRLVREMANLLFELSAKQLLDRLPATLAEGLSPRLLGTYKALAQAHTNLAMIANIGAPARELHAWVWQCGLFNHSSGADEYQARIAQAEKLTLRLEEAVRQIEPRLVIAKEIDAIKEKVMSNQQLVAETQKTIQDLLKRAQGNLSTMDGHQKGAESARKETEEFRTKAKAASDEATTFGTQVRQFVGEIEKCKKSLNDFHTQAQQVVAENEKATEGIVATNQALQKKVDDILERATGASLFTAFAKRGGWLWWGRLVWGLLTVGVIVGAMWLIYSLGNDLKESKQFDLAILMKASSSLVLVFAIGFCATQYGKERRLEEEYAFKSTISLSFHAYEKLVEELKGRGASDKQIDFAIESIREIWRAPGALKEEERRPVKLDPITSKVMDLVKEVVSQQKKS